VIAAVVPAAGRSERMGQPKLLLELGGTSLIRHVLQALQEGGVDRIVVVVPSTQLAESTALAAQARSAGAIVIVPDDQPAEMRVSVELAIKQLAIDQPPDLLLLVPGDSPGISAELVTQLCEHASRAPGRIVIPTFRAKRGHPVVFPWEIVATLPQLDPGLGLNALVARHGDRVIEVPMNDSTVLLDLDTPQDLSLWVQNSEATKNVEVPSPPPTAAQELTVRLFALAKDRVGSTEVKIQLGPEATIGELRRQLTERWPELTGLWSAAMIAINENYATDADRIDPNSRLAVIPPVSGGGGDLDADSEMT
jgi:molybdenum cofactor cytidylyltransferase